MSKTILLQEYISINSVDLSAYVTKAELSFAGELKKVTTFGSGGWEENLVGILSGDIKIEFEQDFAAAALDSLMWPLFIARTAVAWETRASNAAVGTSNPKWTGSLLVAQWNPITGGVGDDAKVSVTFPFTAVVTRGTS